jgi:hypothetical protein
MLYFSDHKKPTVMNNELFSHINWLAVLVAAVAYFMLGALWYSKALFANSWIKAANINMSDPNMRKGIAQIMVTSFILMFIASVGLAVIISRVGASGWMTGLKVGLLASICFSATGISISYLYEKKPMTLHMINCLYHVVGCSIAGIIIAVWP